MQEISIIRNAGNQDKVIKIRKNEVIGFKVSTELKKDFIRECERLNTTHAELLRKFVIGVTTNEPIVTQAILWLFRNPRLEDKYKKNG